MTTKQELINRWDKFLSQIENRFNESLQHAEEASFALLEENDYDYDEVIQAFTGMKSQIRNLIKKIDQTWDNKVRPKMEKAFDNTDWVDESCKGNELSQKLWDKLMVFQVVLEGKLSQRYYDHVIQIVDEHFHCSQCNAQLQIDKRIFRSQYITCNYCDTVNTFEPETKFAHLGWGIIDNIVTLNLWEEKKEILTLEEQIKELSHYKKATDTDWKNFKTKYLGYYERFFKERIKLNSELEERFEEDMKRRHEIYNTIKNS